MGSGPKASPWSDDPARHQRFRLFFMSPAMYFTGLLSDLKAIVSLLHLQGHWIDRGLLHIFTTDRGEHINFWPANGELQVQGRSAARRDLEQRLAAIIAKIEPSRSSCQPETSYPILSVTVVDGFGAMAQR